MMSTYKGLWPEKAKFAEADIKVTVDGQPLPPNKAEVPAAGQAFGWGTSSTWAGRKLLSYSLLHYELHHVMGLPASLVHSYLLDMADIFMQEQVAKLEKQWTMTSDDISQWIRARYPKIWEDLMSHQTPA